MTSRWILTFALALAPVTATAQDTVVVRTGRPTRVSSEAVSFFNAPSTTRVFGRFTVGSDDVYPGNVAVLDGPVRISGVIEGDLVAINANVSLLRGAEIRGDVLVLGGTLATNSAAHIGGTVRLYRRSIDVRRARDRLELMEEEDERDDDYWRDRFRRRRGSRYREPHASIVVSTAGTYNRVEGLPILIGPELEWGGHVHGRIRALGVFRTAGDFDSNREDIGYALDGSLRVGWGRDPVVRLGARAYDVVRSVEDWQLTDEEIGLASVFLHRDYRDYYLQRGFSAYLEIEPSPGFTLSGEISRDEESSISARDPWTLFRGEDVWRANPRIDVGDFTHLRAGLEWDTRYDRRRSSSGWLFRFGWEHGIVEDNFVPRPLPLAVRAPPSLTDYSYDRVVADIRRYERIGWSGELRLRAFGAGAVGDNPLPLQRRLSLGGPDPMPGFPFRRFACNGVLTGPAKPALCDRIVLFQAEYRGDLFFGVFDRVFDHRTRRERERHHGRYDPRDWDDWGWFGGPDIALFANAGTGWLRSEDPGELEFDVGAGLVFGSFGVYGAKALDEDEPVRFLVRFHQRF